MIEAAQDMIDIGYHLSCLGTEGEPQWSELAEWSKDERRTIRSMIGHNLIEGNENRIRLTVRGLGWVLNQQLDRWRANEYRDDMSEKLTIMGIAGAISDRASAEPDQIDSDTREVINRLLWHPGQP